MKLPASPRFPWPGRGSGAQPPILHRDGASAPLTGKRWSRCELLIGRGRCRLRWFRLQGLPPAERLAALRLQAEAWRPFDDTDARLVLQDEQGLAIAWDAAALARDLLAAGLAPERCRATPEVLARPPLPDGLHLLQLDEGVEAQHWRDGELRASRWWPGPVGERDWAAFARASGASRELPAEAPFALPPLEPASHSPQGWCRHQALRAGQDQDRQIEGRLVLAAVGVLLLAAGGMAHQLAAAWSDSRVLAAQVAELRSASAGPLARRDAVLAQQAELEQLARWLSLPQPVEVLAHLAERLGRSAVQLKEFELEGERVRIALQPGPNTSRASLVRELQAGGWFGEVNEARSGDGQRGLLVFEARLKGAAPPQALEVAGSAPQAAAPAPAAAVPPAGPAKPIMAKPDAQGMPPASVFDAIPNR